MSPSEILRHRHRILPRASPQYSLPVIRQNGFYVPSVLLIEEQHVVVQDEGCLIEAFLHVEKAEATDP